MTAGNVASPTRRTGRVSYAVMLCGLPLWVWYCQISVIGFDGVQPQDMVDTF